MPKLDKDAATKVAEVESSTGIMDEGVYEMTLIEVQARPGEKGPYWSWTFKMPEDAPRYGKWQQWLNTSLSEASAWKLKEVFDAFGVPTDTDTDELIGRKVRIKVVQTTAKTGKRAGELVNQVAEVLPLENPGGEGGSSAKTGGKNLF